MADRNVKIILDAKVSGLIAGFKTAGKAVDSYAAKTDAFVQKNSASIEELGRTSAFMGAGLLAGVGVVVKSFADFDEQMSAVQASTRASASDMELLRQKAIQVGGDTKFSATEAAQGIDEMSKAGVSAKDILNGGLSGAMDLAAAGGLGVADAAETAASAMTMFKLEGKDIPHIADLMAASAGKAQGSVGDLGQALNQVGGIAHLNGLSIEETSAALAAMASNGYLGSDAGTSFKTMLMNLAPTTEAASIMVEKLGLNAYDSQGKFIGLEAYAGKLKKGLGTLSEEQRMSTLKTLFGTDAIRAASVMYEQGAEGVAEWTKKVNDAGYAQETAALKMDNLKGDIENLSGSIDSVFLKSGSAANDSLRDLVKSVEELVDWIGTLDPRMLQTGLTIAGVSGGALLMGGAIAGAVTKTSDLINAFGSLQSSGGRAAGVIGKVGKASLVAAGAAVIMGGAATLINDKWRTLDATSAEGFTNAISGMSKTSGDAAKSIDKNFDAANLGVTDLDSAIKRVFSPEAYQGFDDFMRSTFGQGDVAGINTTKEAFKDLDTAISGMAKSGNTEDAAAAFQLVKKSAQDQGVPLEKLMTLFPEYRDVLKDAATAAGKTQLSQEDLNSAMDGSKPVIDDTTESLEAQAEAYDDLLELQRKINGGVISERDAQREMADSVEGAIEKLQDYKKELVEKKVKEGMSKEAAVSFANSMVAQGKALDISTKAGRDNQKALDSIASSSWELIEAMNATETDQATMMASMEQSRQKFIDTAVAMGMGRDEAISLADKMNLIPQRIALKVSQTGAAQTGADIDAIANKKRTATIEVKSTRPPELAATYEKYFGWKDPAPSIPSMIRRASGGIVRGPGTGTSDSINARLSNGEYVVKATAVKALGEDNLNKVNQGLMPARAVPIATGSGGLTDADRSLLMEVASRPTIGQITGGPKVDTEELGKQVLSGIAWGMKGKS